MDALHPLLKIWMASETANEPMSLMVSDMVNSLSAHLAVTGDSKAVDPYPIRPAFEAGAAKLRALIDKSGDFAIFNAIQVFDPAKVFANGAPQELRVIANSIPLLKYHYENNETILKKDWATYMIDAKSFNSGAPNRTILPSRSRSRSAASNDTIAIVFCLIEQRSHCHHHQHRHLHLQRQRQLLRTMNR